MGAPVELFEVFAAQAELRPGISRNSKGSLVVDGGVRAMTSKGAIVVKLEPARVKELVLAGEGRHYKNQINAWLELSAQLPDDRCRTLLDDSLTR